MLDGLFRHAVNLLAAAHVGCQRHDPLSSFGSQFPGSGRQFLPAPCHNRNVHTLTRQLQGNGLADAAAAAGHDRLFASQSEVHGLPFCVEPSGRGRPSFERAVRLATHTT